MANSKINSKEKKKGLKQEVIGIALVFVSLFLIISLLSYSEANIASNWGGIVGGYTAWLLFKVVGYSAYIFPILIIILALEFLIR
ncbi:MAG: DNA translocase FtsK 4TM domain-containing protein, partial [Deltaproteobacteria bacterium]|nr:DNA translocase FtsK 4TM domain-containing protein [Deltaproteobacteria bacterium]